MKDFSLIAAVALNGVIGDSSFNIIPWYLPLDLKHFRSVTTGKTVVMGSRTFDSIGKPLPKRRNVVITRDQEKALTLRDEGVDETYTNFADMLQTEQAGFFVIGGSHLYKEAMLYSSQSMHITIVDMNAEGDVRFPIAGERFKQDVLHVNDNLHYNCAERSGWLDDQGIRFQFCRFDRA